MRSDRRTVSNKIAKHRDPIGSGPVKYEVNPAHPGALNIRVEYESAPPPPHFYVADFFRVTELGMVVLMEFGKLTRPTASALRSKLEIYFPIAMFMNQFWTNSREFYKVLEKFVTESGFRADSSLTDVTETDKVQTLHSNNVLTVLAGGECMMDFFYISPKELWAKPPKQGNIDMEALVRVICAPTLALGFYDACAPIADKIRERPPAWIGDADALESK